MAKLRPKERGFVREYFKDFHGGAAAVRAGYSPGNDNGARQAWRLWQSPKVRTAIAIMQKIATEESIASHRECCMVLTERIRARVPNYLTPEGEIDLEALQGDEHAAAIESVEIEEAVRNSRGDVVRGRRVRFRLCDKTKAIERLAKMRGYDEADKLDTRVVVKVLPLEHW